MTLSTASTLSPEDIAALLEARRTVQRLKTEIHKVIYGQDEMLDVLFTAMFARGHVMLRSEPGKAKTTTVDALGRAFYRVVDNPGQPDHGTRVGVSARISCTPDMANPCGTWFVDPHTHELTAYPAAIMFANIVLADELNRTEPKTQAPLLEVMQEYRYTMTYGGFKRVVCTPRPFFFMATQNPIEQDGTYPIPEAQLDRFLFMYNLPYPDEDSEMRVAFDANLAGYNPTDVVDQIVDIAQLGNFQTLVEKVPVSEEVGRYALRLVRSTRPGEKGFLPDLLVPRQGGGQLKLGEVLQVGASPRASIAAIRAARALRVVTGTGDTPESFNVTFDDIRKVAPMVLGHRMFTTLTGSRVDKADIVSRLIETVPLDGHYEDAPINTRELLEEAGAEVKPQRRSRLSFAIDGAIKLLERAKGSN